MSPLFSAVFDRVLFILAVAGNNDIHKSLDEFEFGQDQKTNYGVSCPCASKKSMPPLFLGRLLFIRSILAL